MQARTFSRTESDDAETSDNPKFNITLALVAFAMTIAVGAIAWWQPPFPFPAKPFSERSLIDQALYPYESNGELRLWQPIPILNSVAASSNGKYLLAVGNGGSALYSDDGGRKWRIQTTGLTENLTYSWITDDGLKGGAVTFEGAEYEFSPDRGAWTLANDGKQSKVSISSELDASPSPYFNNRSAHRPQGMPPGTQIERFVSRDISNKSEDIQVSLVVPPTSPDCKPVWAIGEFGTVVTSNDCGKAWEIQASALPGSIFSITFLSDGLQGWAAGYGGAVWKTIDGGEHWRSVPTDTHSRLTSIMFLENGNGWVVGENATLMSSTDFGDSWSTVPIQSELPGFLCVYFGPDGMNGRVATDGGTTLSTIDGGANWKSDPVGKPREFSNRQISTDCQFLSGNSRALESVTFDGVNLRITTSMLSPDDAQRGWAGLDDGQIISTRNGWNTVDDSFFPARSTRVSMRYIDTEKSWAVGLHPALARTNDGGDTWSVASSPIEYARYPAPWFWLSLLVVVFLWVIAFRGKIIAVEKGVAAIAASDAPTQSFSQDRLRFGPLAKGISRFLRNEATEPPLTLAITGDWGTGKSSLMTLICKDLQRNGSRPVWFNAWHHQKDEQLLAALLSAIREQSLPPFTSPSGWIFRWRLLILRAQKHWFVATLLLLCGVWVVAYLSMHESTQWQSLGVLIDRISEMAKAEGPLDLLSSLNLGPLAAKFGAIATAFLALRKALTAFGADPAVLLSNSVDQFRLKDASVLTGFRSRFAKEFEEVTQCLPGRLVIIIDDLDRCRAESVLEVMEAVNFLVSSGKCFVIFGMATNRVQAALALSFEKIAQEMGELDAHGQSPLTAGDKADSERTRRRRYARDYLEKLVNIEIAVPETPLDNPHSLLEETPDHTSFEQVLLRRLKALVFGVLLVGAMAFMWQQGERFQFATPAPQTSDQAKTHLSGALTKIEEPETVKPKLNRGAPQNSYRSAVAMDLQSDSALIIVIATVLLAVVGVTYAFFRLQENLFRVQDSPAFKASLAAWSPLVQQHRKTPRALKRFANRLRYLAMLQQAQRLDQSGWDLLPKWLQSWLGLHSEPEADTTAQVNLAEHRIVALGALYEVFGNDWRNFTKSTLPTSELRGAAKSSIKAYCAYDAPGLEITWPPSEEEMQSFSESLAGVRIPT
ncbi:P-loop NTPase fold protein [Pseudomonas sp. R16(2017)]|uniref:P-loop NTPase fold protein n=1 Tax=Pseudomonas sp. R16(2017) TaxID=1981704 RepID=UPI00111BD9AA|nr:P-loop NTPase fold protein [Pseudomonas sp. R16(2017)]